MYASKNRKGFGWLRHVVSAMCLCIIAVVVAGCAGTVSGDAKLDLGVAKLDLKFEGTRVENPGVLTDTGGIATKDGKTYKVYKDADGKLVVYDPDWGYIRIEKYFLNDTQQHGPDDGLDLDLPGQAVPAVAISRIRPLTVPGVHAAFDTALNTAQFDSPIVGGMVFPDPANFHVTAVTDQNGLHVAGTPNRVQLYCMAMGFRSMSTSIGNATFTPNAHFEIRDQFGESMGWFELGWRTVRHPTTGVVIEAGPIFEDVV